VAFVEHGLMAPPFWLAMSGLVAAWFIYTRKPGIAAATARRFNGIYRLLLNKYGFDDFNDTVFGAGFRRIGDFFSNVGDRLLIDGLVVNGAARVVAVSASVLRLLQTGYLYHYSFAMILGLVALLGWFVLNG